MASTTSTGRPPVAPPVEPVHQRVRVALVLPRGRVLLPDRLPPAEVSRSGSKPTSSRLSTLLMSAEEIREVSSSIVEHAGAGDDAVGHAADLAVPADPRLSRRRRGTGACRPARGWR